MSELTRIDEVAGVSIYQVHGQPASFIYRAGMMIDLDGSPNAYGPNNTGLDYTANGGDDQGGNWWGGPTDSNGYPIIQKIYEPCPGLYVSGTAHIDPAYPEESQYRYLNAEAIPFIVLPSNHTCNADLGDACLCYNVETGDNCFGIFADIGPCAKLGEASVRMAEALSISGNPKTGGTQSHCVVYLVFPGSIGEWRPPNEWFQIANQHFKEWGGLARLDQLIPALC